MSVLPPPAAPRSPLDRLPDDLSAFGAQASTSPVVLVSLVRLADVLLLALGGLLLFALYIGDEPVARPLYGTAIGLMSFGAVVVFQMMGLYQLGALRSVTRQAGRLAGGWTMVVLAAMALIFFSKLGEGFSRVWLGGWYLTGFATLLAARVGTAVLVRRLTRSGRLDRRTAIVGGGPSAAELVRALETQDDTGLRIVGLFDDRNDDRSPDVVAGYPKLGTVDDLVAFARVSRIDLVIFSMPVSAETRLLAMLRKLWVLPVDVRLSAHMSRLRYRPRAYSHIGAVPVLDLHDRPIADWDIVLKAAFDRVVGALALLVLSPLMLAVALAVKLDSRGPVLFRQKRHGFNNELIEVFKFRSMHVEKSDANASRLVTRDDDRVTRVGRVIRRASLDELPQLFNVVFKGNLSLVGPRPHALAARASEKLYDEVVDGYFARHRVKPGITGWAQVNGWRGETDTEEKLQKRVEHDLEYIENWSIWFDVKILLLTPLSLLLKRDGAY